MLKERSERVNAARWVAGALGRAGIVVTVGVVPFAVWVRSRFGGAEETADGVSSVWWLPGIALLLLFALAVRVRIAANGDLDRRATPDHTGYLLAFGILAVIFAAIATPGRALPWTSSPREFIPSEEAIGMWLAALLIVLGAALYLGTLATPPERPRGRWWVGAPAGVLVVVLTAALVTPLAGYRPVSHTFLSEEPGEPAPVPIEASTAAWTWDPPGGAAVVSVDAGTHGPVVVLRDGLVGLDGETGEELWSIRAPYSHAEPRWGTGVFDNRNDLASLLVTQNSQEQDEEDEEVLRQVLDTATGQVVEEAPFGDSAPLDFSGSPHTTPEVYTFWSRNVLYAFGPDYQPLWERPIGEGDPDRFCAMNQPSVHPHGDQIIFGEMCADTEPEVDPEGSEPDWGQRREAAQRSGTVSLVALDVLTGEENWRRDREPHEDESPPILFPGGDPRPGANPVFLVGDRTIDAGTGEDLDVVPADLVALNQYGFAEDGVFLRGDSLGALIAERPEPDSGDPFLLHRTDADGNIMDTTVLPDTGEARSAVDGVALQDVLVHTDITRPADLKEGEEGVSSVVLTPLGEGTVTEEDTRRIDFSSHLLVPPEGGWERRTPSVVETSFVPVPGALVFVLAVGSNSSQTVQLHGLVP